MYYEGLQGKEREEFWREIVNGQSGSGMSCNKYCISKGVNYDRFLYWQGKFRRLEQQTERSLVKSKTDFISLANFIENDEIAVDSSKEESPSIELELPFGIKLKVKGVSR